MRLPGGTLALAGPRCRPARQLSQTEAGDIYRVTMLQRKLHCPGRADRRGMAERGCW